MKVLIWNGKHDPEYIDATDEPMAFLCLFRKMKRAGFYSYLGHVKATFDEMPANVREAIRQQDDKPKHLAALVRLEREARKRATRMRRVE